MHKIKATYIWANTYCVTKDKIRGLWYIEVAEYTYEGWVSHMKLLSPYVSTLGVIENIFPCAKSWEIYFVTLRGNESGVDGN